MMDDLRQMARAPVAIFQRFMAELQRLTHDQSLAASEGAEGAERAQDLQARMVRDIAASLQRFRTGVGEADAALAAILHPPRPDLFGEIKRTVERLQRLQELAARRDRLLRAWEEEPPDAIVEGYRVALERHEPETADLYETEAERVLRRRGDVAVLERFRALCTQALEARLTPAQQQAKVALQEIARLKQQVTSVTEIVASTLKSAGGLAGLAAGWRTESRLRVGEPGLRVRILSDPHPGRPAAAVEVSRAGLRLALPDALRPGTLLDLAVEPAPGRRGELWLQGEVRWCQTDVHTPGGCLAGVQVVADGGGPWADLLHRLTEVQRGAPAGLEARRP